MFQQIYGWIQNITVYLIVTAAVLYAVPGKDYGKYIKFFSGLILILLLAMPILSLTDMKATFRDLYKSSEYEFQKQEIESAEEVYRNLDLEEYMYSMEGEKESGNSGETDGSDEISVGEIEVGEK